MSAPHPAVTVRVEAAPDASVRIDDKPVTLDAHGAGAYLVDEAAATLGPADESRTVSLSLAYTVTAQGGTPEKGTVAARVASAPLRVDAPGPKVVVEEDHVVLAGRGPKGATVTVDGAPVTVAADGAFEATVPLVALGEHVIETRAQTPALLPRRVTVSATRVASLADAARDFEQTSPIGYDVAMSDLPGKVGQPIVVEGQVLEARGVAHRTLVLVDDRRGCARGPCLARVVVGKDLALAHGDVLSCVRRRRARLHDGRGPDRPRGRQRLRGPDEEVTSRAAAVACLACAAAGAAVAFAAAAQTVDVERPRTLVVGTPPGARVDRVDGARTGRVATALPTGGLRSEWRLGLGVLVDQAPLVERPRGDAWVLGTRGEVIAVGRDGTELWRAHDRRHAAGPGRRCSRDDTLVFADAAGEAVAVRAGASSRWRVRFARSRSIAAGAPRARRRRRRRRHRARPGRPRRRRPRARPGDAARGRRGSARRGRRGGPRGRCGRRRVALGARRGGARAGRDLRLGHRRRRGPGAGRRAPRRDGRGARTSRRSTSPAAPRRPWPRRPEAFGSALRSSTAPPSRSTCSRPWASSR